MRYHCNAVETEGGSRRVRLWLDDKRMGQRGGGKRSKKCGYMSHTGGQWENQPPPVNFGRVNTHGKNQNQSSPKSGPGVGGDRVTLWQPSNLSPIHLTFLDVSSWIDSQVRKRSKTRNIYSRL